MGNQRPYSWRLQFITEIRKVDGSRYPPATLKEMILQRIPICETPPGISLKKWYNLLTFYFTHCLYINPLQGIHLSNPKTEVWYKASPLDVHSIESATKVFMSSVSLHSDKFVSNTSLRRTAMNRLIGAGGILQQFMRWILGNILFHDRYSTGSH